MLNNRLFIGSTQAVIILGATAAQYLQLFLLPVLLIPLLVSIVGAWKGSVYAKPYYQHIRTTSLVSLIIFTVATSLLFAGVVVDHQLQLAVPEFLVIQENPEVFMAFAANSLNLFGVIYLCLAGYIAWRSYRCLVPLTKRNNLNE